MNNANNFTDDVMNNVNQVIKDAGDRAKEELMGGQSSFNSASTLMGGIGEIHHEAGIMQGQNGATTNIFEGLRTDKTVDINPTMPGQGISGINANNFSVQNEPLNVSIPDENNVPKPVEDISIPNTFENITPPPVDIKPMNAGLDFNRNYSTDENGYRLPNTSIDLNTPDINVPPVDINTPSVDITPEIPNGNMPNIDINTPDINVPSVDINTPSVDITPEIPNINIPNVDINTPDMNMPNVNMNGPEVNMPNIQPMPNINEQPQMNPNLNLPPVMDGQNNMAQPMAPVMPNNMNNQAVAINPNMNMAPVQPVQSQPMMDNVNYDEAPKKKWPLTLRETILVTIAIIGVIVVIFMYK